MKTQTKKRNAILSLILGIVLIFSTIPMVSATAFAQTTIYGELNTATDDEAKLVESIKIVKLPNQLDYIVGASHRINLDGMEIKINYTDGSSKLCSYDKYMQDSNNEDWPFSCSEIPYHVETILQTPVDSYGYEIGYLDIKMGKNTVELKHYHSDFSVNFEINGIECPVTKLEITKLPNKVLSDKFVKESEVTPELYDKSTIAQNMEGAELKVYYKDGTTEIFNFDNTSVIAVSGSPNYGGYKIDKYSVDEYIIDVYDQWNYQATLYFMGKSVTFTANHMGEPLILTDETTGISVSGNITSDMILKVEKINVNLTSVKTAYDITLLKDGQAIQPNGEITISIPYDEKGCMVFWVREDNTTENMNAVYKDGKYVFSINHLSKFAIVDSNIKQTDDTKDINSNITATNDTVNISSSDNGIIATGKESNVFLIVALIAISGMILIVLKRRQNN